ncbi:allophanate hydrolase subunit 1 [Planosporangium flavigriseum]|uniref:Allophanate hydrolase n=1 Tax=Planosporangium flavigriseum TaxID=373681 RepID=A0A8J3PMZ9_9ACTN|nr:5-oxoprolinase subunit PxpB [Planosporangium flavigriseum]GIG75422.1 allophanate hydrolase [Planosporangium flavigriseum]
MLVELAGTDEVMGLYRALSAAPPAGVVDLVPAARTLLVMFDPARTGVDSLARVVEGADPAAGAEAPAATVELPVSYDGPDLDAVADLTGLSPAEVVRRHTGAEYTVAFCGFAPGFAYLTGGDPALRVPRRDSPRTEVPAGAVGLAGEFTGVYPRPLPGGWQLIGRTAETLWDVDRDQPALLVPGTRVRFVAQ